MKMESGKCLFVQKEATAIFKLVGRLRFNNSGSLAAKIDGLHSMQDIKEVVIDMSDTDFVDSTVLGLIAQLSKSVANPIIMYKNVSIYKMLKHLGFHKIFILCEKNHENKIQENHLFDDFEELKEIKNDSNEKLKERISKAHKLLYEIDEKNKIEFGDVASYLLNNMIDKEF